MAYVKAIELEKLICEVLFQGVTANLPATYYVGMGDGSLPLKDATLASVVAQESNAPGVGGYSRLALNRDTTDFPTLALVAGDWKVTSKMLHWLATLDWTGDCDFVFLCDVATGSAGKFFGAVSLDPPFVMVTDGTFDDNFEYQDR